MTAKYMMPHFQAIQQFTKAAPYAVDVPWSHLLKHVQSHVEDYGLEVNPDFQRGHVWDRPRQIKFVEFVLQGGSGASDLRLNAPGWARGQTADYVLVDGLQRLTAALGFLNDEVPAFGYKHSEFGGTMRLHWPSFRWNVNDLATRAQVLRWYLEINTGGIVHTDEELDRVRALLEAEKSQ